MVLYDYSVSYMDPANLAGSSVGACQTIEETHSWLSVYFSFNYDHIVNIRLFCEVT